MDARTGKKIRLGRLVRPASGRAVVVAASHGVTSGPPAGLRSTAEIRSVFSKLMTADGVMVTPGMVPLLEDTFTGRDKPGLILHLDWKNHARGIYTPGADGRGEGVLAQLADLEAVAAAGVDAVMTYLYLGQRDTRLERAEVERNARIARDCERLGLGLIIEPRSALEGVDPDALSAEVMSMYCRISADIGADLVKALWPGSPEAFAEVTESCYVPILLAGGKGATTRSTRSSWRTTPSPREGVASCSDGASSGPSGRSACCRPCTRSSMMVTRSTVPRRLLA